MTNTGYEQHDSSVDLPPAILRHWVHSREEDAEGLEVYRPEGFEFPASFGRDGFEMHENGDFVQEDIGPADGVIRVPGRWAALGPLQVAVSFGGAATREGFTFEIVAVDDAVLRIRRGPQPTIGQTPRGDCRNWAAWTDLEPPGPATLHVVGECEFPSGGFTVELRRHEPQGINPRDLLLDKVVTPPFGPATQVITTVEARYREETTAGFDTVTILPDGPSIEITEAR